MAARVAPFVLLLAAAAAYGLPQNSEAIKASADQKFHLGDYDGALKGYEQALASVAAGPDSTEAAGLMLDAAKVLWLKGDYPRSKTLSAKALDIYERAGDTRQASAALSAIGYALHGAGDYTAAAPVFERALSLSENALGPEARETVIILERLAANQSRGGDYAKAKVLEERALEICERRFGAQDALTGEALRVLSQILTELGDYPTAQKNQLRALAILERQLGKDAVEVGDTLVTMGNAAKDSGYYSQAKEYYARAASTYEKRLGPHNTKLAGALDDLGQDLVLMKRFDEARSVFERALAIQTKELGPTHPWTANLIQGLAKVESGIGNYEKARQLYEQNLKIWRDRLGPTHPFTVVSIALLSDVLAHLGRYQMALDTAIQAAGIRRDDILLTVRTVDERQALRYADLHTTSMDTALTIASRGDTPAGARVKVWDALIRSRALVLDEMGARHRSIQQSKDPDLADLAQKTAGARSLIAKLVLQGPGKLTPLEYSWKVERARSEMAQAEEMLALKSAGFRRELERRRAGYEEVRAALRKGTALVAFRRYSHRNYEIPGDSQVESYLAFVLAASDREPVIVRLGSAARVESLVKKWRGEIDRERTSLGRAAAGNESAYHVAAGALRRAVWDPIRRQLGNVNRIYIVPDGALQVVNFAALPAAGGRYLVERAPLLHLLSAERDLSAPAAAPSGTELLAVADPQFQATPQVLAAGRAVYRGARSACQDFASMQFSSLPGSLEEMRAIMHIWNSRGWHGQALSGVGATETAVKNMVAGKRVVHLATHGFFLDGRCPGGSVAGENPLLRSGLALSGANRRQNARPDEEDGILTAEEVASLDMEETEWAVLSGCDTGLGDIRTGEGVLGLRRAFQEAGARTLIASLWPVEDQEARQWMVALYRARFVEGKGTAESVRDADLKRLRARRAAGKSTHPFYWAGFVAVGDWR